MGYFLGKLTPSPSGSAFPVTGITLDKAIAASQSSTPGLSGWDWRNPFGTIKPPISGTGIRRRTTGETFDTLSNDVEEIGEWQWPEEMRDLYSMFLGKAGDLLTRTPGFSQDEIDSYFGRDFEKIRGQERGSREQISNELAAQGMLGTGTALDALTKNAWNTERNVAQTKENVFLANEAQKRQDEQAFAALASQLFGQGQDFLTTEEALNAARRNEANQALAMLLSYFAASQGSQGG